MIIAQLMTAMDSHKVQFGGKKSINKLLTTPSQTKDERFKLFLEILSVIGWLWVSRIDDPEISAPVKCEYSVVYKYLADAAMYSANETIVAEHLKSLVIYLASEFILDLENNGEGYDFESIPEIFLGESSPSQFFTKKLVVKSTTTEFSIKAKSGKVFDGKNLKELTKMTEVDLMDMLEGIQLNSADAISKDQTVVLDFILGNKWALKDKFTNYRICLIAYVNWIYKPELRNNVIVFVLEELKIPHTYGPPAQDAVKAIKKAKSLKTKA